MKWYVFNDKEGNATVNVILDHNTTARVACNSTGNNSEMKEVADALKRYKDMEKYSQINNSK